MHHTGIILKQDEFSSFLLVTLIDTCEASTLIALKFQGLQSSSPFQLIVAAGKGVKFLLITNLRADTHLPSRVRW